MKQTRVSIWTILLILAALSLAVVFLEFPPLWALGILVVLLVLALLLAVRQSPPGSNRLLLGLAAVAVVVGLAINGLLAVPPTIPEDLPEEVLVLPAAYDSVPMGAERFVVFYVEGSDLRLSIQFDSFGALDGYWAYDDAWVDASQALRGTYDADPPRRPETWPDTIYTEENDPNDTITPAFTVELPIDDKHLYDEVQIEARMVITYPRAFGRDSYDVEQERLAREFTLFVASPQDRLLRQQQDRYNRLNGLITAMPLAAVVWGAGALGLLLTFWGFSKIGRAGGYGTLQPALLGKLGAVVADTTLVSAQIKRPLPKGAMIVGKVRPNSPAERAGLLPGDILIEADGLPIDSHRAAKNTVGKWKPNESHTLAVQRGDQSTQIFVQM
ncbi:MAG: PDZ domain-containing protein [Chloroflexi bacterium]|nr:PDZ domain-containing protein [Chloroflexota bacterium]